MNNPVDFLLSCAAESFSTVTALKASTLHCGLVDLKLSFSCELGVALVALGDLGAEDPGEIVADELGHLVDGADQVCLLGRTERTIESVVEGPELQFEALPEEVDARLD